jgi:hypothetical protein
MPPPPPAPPPSKSAAPLLAEDSYEPPLVEPDNNYEPPPVVEPEKTIDHRLRAIVEGAKKRDVDVREKRPRSTDREEDLKVAVNVDLAGNAVVTAAGNCSTTKDSVLASSSAWPTPAQASKKVKISKKDEVAPDTFYGSQVCFFGRSIT